mmetsp:Transcript_19128/g.62794  ORF Transcript_19128/g.62794 Transcript_19128/m.62794 type:complete len:303 (+) Transcript_19128:1769-2677(+)
MCARRARQRRQPTRGGPAGRGASCGALCASRRRGAGRRALRACGAPDVPGGLAPVRRRLRRRHPRARPRPGGAPEDGGGGQGPRGVPAAEGGGRGSRGPGRDGRLAAPAGAAPPLRQRRRPRRRRRRRRLRRRRQGGPRAVGGARRRRAGRRGLRRLGHGRRAVDVPPAAEPRAVRRRLRRGVHRLRRRVRRGVPGVAAVVDARRAAISRAAPGGGAPPMACDRLYHDALLWRAVFAEFWAEEQLALVKAGAALGPDRYALARVEDLVADPGAARVLLDWVHGGAYGGDAAAAAAVGLSTWR